VPWLYAHQLTHSTGTADCSKFVGIRPIRSHWHLGDLPLGVAPALRAIRKLAAFELTRNALPVQAPDKQHYRRLSVEFGFQ